MTTEEMLVTKYGPIMTTADLAEALKYDSAKAVANAYSAGKLPFTTFRRGKRRLAHASDVAAYIEGIRRDAAQQASGVVSAAPES